MIDKIVQIIKGDDRYTVHGISERGNLYAIKVSKEGDLYWGFVCTSPEIEEGGKHE